MTKNLLLAASTLAAALVLMPETASGQNADTTKKDTPAAARPAGAISDSAIIAMLQLSHTQQVAAAEMASTRAQSDRVKQFAETLKTDHGKALQELEAFAARLDAGNRGMSSGVARDSGASQPGRDSAAAKKPAEQPPEKPAEHPAPSGNPPEVSFENLGGLSGHEFEHGFVRLQVQHHETEINHLRNDVIPMIKNSDLKALVQGYLPALGRHLTQARDLEGYLKTTN